MRTSTKSGSDKPPQIGGFDGLDNGSNQRTAECSQKKTNPVSRRRVDIEIIADNACQIVGTDANDDRGKDWVTIQIKAG
ncbi:hypothetical protein [Pectobacterium versatile]|uniref:hypothetical protein n=1 Tax=Pectobacterium versatile TaxID=2488639 RepID=UPI002B245BBB|nr:hypothetical protein [Pectobacterium versatile]